MGRSAWTPHVHACALEARYDDEEQFMRALPFVLDVRPRERAPVLLLVGTLFAIASAQACLETARDGLLLTTLPARAFAWGYLVGAACAVPAAVVFGPATARFGARQQHLRSRRRREQGGCE